MTFNTLTFFLFFGFVITSFRLTKGTIRDSVLLISSFIFYSLASVKNLPYLFGLTIVTFTFSNSIRKVESDTKKIFLLTTGISLIALTLILFKILNLKDFYPLPIGISFYSFVGIAYLVESYRFEEISEKNFIKFASFFSFFPTVTSGPILRYEPFRDQIQRTSSFSEDFGIGIRRLLYGLFLKVVVVENITENFNEVWRLDFNAISAIDVWTTAFLSGIYIYLDFSSYSHMAIGCAQLLGIKIPENFNFPYVSKNPQEFWKRWHISLSNWLFEFIFQTVQLKIRDFKRESIGAATIIGILSTFIICGLWHGLTIGFFIWGLYHGILIIIYSVIKKSKGREHGLFGKFFSWAITLTLIMLGWLFFYARDFETIKIFLIKLFTPGDYLWLGLRENTYLNTALIFIFIFLVQFLGKVVFKKLQKFKLAADFAEIVLLTLIIILIFIFFIPTNQFIYFQF